MSRLSEAAVARRMEAVAAIAGTHGSSVDAVMSRCQTPAARSARRTAMLAMRERFDDPVDTIAAVFGRCRRQVQYCMAAAAGIDDRGARDIVAQVARAHGLPVDELLHGTSRRRWLMTARCEAVCAVFDNVGGSPAGVAAMLGIDQTTVRNHLRAGGLL